MADRISEQCFDLAIGLYACSDTTIEYCRTIRRLVRGLEDELLAARAEVERLRNHIKSAETAFNVALGAIRLSLEQADEDRDALRAEVERLRADMREAVELLGAFNFTIALGTLGLHERRTALLTKHKETQ